MSQKRYITDIDGNVMTCMLCGADAWYNDYEDRFEFDCPCGEIDISLLPEFLIGSGNDELTDI